MKLPKFPPEFPGSNPHDEVQRDLERSLAEENEAVANYAERAGRARRAGREDIAQMYEHILDEERHHIGEILAVGFTDTEEKEIKGWR